ncbi:integrase core domain-containing protein, partial [Escherichia coli]|nr:integrase core domain-containing protein [Escherichia coli]
WEQYEQLAKWLIYFGSIIEIAGTKYEKAYLEAVEYSMSNMSKERRLGYSWHAYRAWETRWSTAGLIHHSDRGSQYCAYDYRVIQEQFGLKTSMSRKGNCYDNAPMESFWGTLKNESLSHYRFNNRDEAISVI